MTPQPAAAPTPPTHEGPTPERIMQYGWGFAATWALSSAIEIDLFTHVAGGKTTPAAVAAAAKVTPRGARMLADAMVGMGLLTRTGAAGPLGLAPDAATFLVKGTPAYLGDFFLLHARGIGEQWVHLTDTVRTGKPPMAVDKPVEGVPLWHRLVDALFPLGFRAATQVGTELARLYPRKDLHVLDVAAGSGVWGLGAATANPRVRVTAQDLPETLEHTRRWTERLGLGPRTAFLAGDLRTTDFGTEAFDAAILGHICHSEGPVHAPRLLAKVGKALKKGGTIVVAEFVPAPDRNGPPMPLLFALNMLVHTTEGDTFTLPQYRTWLEAARFTDVREMPAAAPSPLILATKA